MRPASILQKHDNVTLYLDREFLVTSKFVLGAPLSGEVTTID